MSSPPFGLPRPTVAQLKKMAEHTKVTTFGSSAIFKLKTRRFPPLPRKRFGIIELEYYYLLIITICQDMFTTRTANRRLVMKTRNSELVLIRKKQVREQLVQNELDVKL